MKSLKKLVIENKVCPIPWVHAEVNGSTKELFPCCKYKKSVGYIDKDFLSVWNNEEYKQIRWDLSNNQPHEHCSACNVKENSFSYKKWKTSQYLRQFILDDIDTEIPNKPKVLHIGGFSNLCNLACRMCKPTNSSRLESIFQKTDLKKYFPLYTIPNDLSVDAFDDIIENIHYLTISGGEPFIDKKVFLFLKKFKNSKNIKGINFSSNLTKINFQLLDFLSSLKISILISVSLDGDKKIHEFIRYGCDYDSIIKNIKIISEKYPRIKININTTVSVYNVGYISETLDSFLNISKETNLKISDLMVSPVLDPKFLHPGVLPNIIKEKYLEKISKISKSKYVSIPQSTTLIETSKNLLLEDHQKHYHKFLDYTKIFDNYSKIDYLKIYPELAPLERFELP